MGYGSGHGSDVGDSSGFGGVSGGGDSGGGYGGPGAGTSQGVAESSAGFGQAAGHGGWGGPGTGTSQGVAEATRSFEQSLGLDAMDALGVNAVDAHMIDRATRQFEMVANIPSPLGHPMMDDFYRGKFDPSHPANIAPGISLYDQDLGVSDPDMQKALDNFQIGEVINALDAGLSMEEIGDYATIGMGQVVGLLASLATIGINPVAGLLAGARALSMMASRKSLNLARAMDVSKRGMSIGQRVGTALASYTMTPAFGPVGAYVGFAAGMAYAAHPAGLGLGQPVSDRGSIGWGGIGTGTGDGMPVGTGVDRTPHSYDSTPGMSIRTGMREAPDSPDIQGTSSLLRFLSAYSMFNSLDKMSMSNMLGDMIFSSTILPESEYHVGLDQDAFIVQAAGFSGFIYLFDQIVENEKNKILQ